MFRATELINQIYCAETLDRNVTQHGIIEISEITIKN